MHPDLFNCQLCERGERDLERGCPKCLLTEKVNYYADQTVKLAIKFAGGFPKGWTLDGLMRMHGEVAALLERSKGRIKGKWDVRLARLCRVYLGERAHARAATDYATLKRLQTPSAGGLTQIARNQQGRRPLT